MSSQISGRIMMAFGRIYVSQTHFGYIILPELYRRRTSLKINPKGVSGSTHPCTRSNINRLLHLHWCGTPSKRLLASIYNAVNTSITYLLRTECMCCGLQLSCDTDEETLVIPSCTETGEDVVGLLDVWGGGCFQEGFLRNCRGMPSVRLFVLTNERGGLVRPAQLMDLCLVYAEAVNQPVYIFLITHFTLM